MRSMTLIASSCTRRSGDPRSSSARGRRLEMRTRLVRRTPDHADRIRGRSRPRKRERLGRLRPHADCGAPSRAHLVTARAYKWLVNRTPLQFIVDPFVKFAGGEVVSELIEKNPKQPPTQADYFFRHENVILELKALETPSFGESYVRKLSALTDSWVERGMLIVYGTARVDLQRMHPICQQEWLEVLADPLQRNVIAKANRQISRTKELLGARTAKGLLWLASDGNLDLQPQDVWFLVSRILGKKTSEGQKQFSGIDSVIYFHPRAPAIAPGVPADVFLWLADAREPDQQVRDFISFLRDRWIQWLSATSGLNVVAIERGPALSTVRFAGSAAKLPRVSLSDSKDS